MAYADSHGVGGLGDPKPERMLVLVVGAHVEPLWRNKPESIACVVVANVGVVRAAAVWASLPCLSVVATSSAVSCLPCVTPPWRVGPACFGRGLECEGSRHRCGQLEPLYVDQRLFVNKHNSDVKTLHTTGGLLSLGLGCLKGRFVGRSVATPFLQSAAAAPRLEGFVLQGEEEEPFHVACASLQDRKQTLHAFRTQEEEKQPQVEEETVSEGPWPEQPLQWELRAPFAQVERQACKRRSGNLAAQEPLSAVRAAVSCVAELHGVKWTPASHLLLSGTEKVAQCLAPEGSWLRRQEGKPGLARFVSFVEPPRPFAEGDVPHAIREGLASHQSVVGLCATANGKHSEGSSQPEARSRVRRFWLGWTVFSVVFLSIPILKRINLASSVSMCPKLHLRPWPNIKHDQHIGFRCLGNLRDK